MILGSNFLADFGFANNLNVKEEASHGVELKPNRNLNLSVSFSWEMSYFLRRL